ncbi:hypothetical protein H2204_013079 [Knufia peltigerae]|uniref:EthD domain-containing protein n=1 Tax=Knufia peltigerae TaxID=1002370 RepID=A0AA39CSB9_9EURO|nr:hypothetical protein H2204_013079 [Knufia peltigerae]
MSSTQVFDSVFGARQGGPFNANQHWVGRDDVTELFFRNGEHVLRCFTSDHVKEKVGPDGAQFADFETNVVLMAHEKVVDVIDTRLATRRLEPGLFKPGGSATVALYFISSADHGTEGKRLEARLTPLLVDALQRHCQDEVWRLEANIGTASKEFDLASYFGGGGMPPFCLVYKAFLKGRASVPFFRKSQRTFEATAHENFDVHSSFVLFGEEALIMDMDGEIRFAPDRQPCFPDLPGPTHLSI